MREKLYTIELTDAVKSGDECCFCWLERKMEQENLEFVLGSSYMESDVRDQTSLHGFCRHHTKMMYDYGNTLGNAWILKSRMEKVRADLAEKLGMESATSAETKKRQDGILKSLFSGKTGKKKLISGEVSESRSHENCGCYICERMDTIYARMLDTFAWMLEHDPDFGETLMKSKGFCLRHFEEAEETCERTLKSEVWEAWKPKLNRLMLDNLDRVQEDVNWLIEKYDYRNKDADWKESRDAVPRAMQKLAGTHPADPVFRDRR